MYSSSERELEKTWSGDRLQDELEELKQNFTQACRVRSVVSHSLSAIQLQAQCRAKAPCSAWIMAAVSSLKSQTVSLNRFFKLPTAWMYLTTVSFLVPPHLLWLNPVAARLWSDAEPIFILPKSALWRHTFLFFSVKASFLFLFLPEELHAFHMYPLSCSRVKCENSEDYTMVLSMTHHAWPLLCTYKQHLHTRSTETLRLFIIIK